MPDQDRTNGDGIPSPDSGRAAHEPPGRRIRLIKGGALLLEPNGFRIIATRGFKRSPSKSYESITHIAATRRALLVATTSGLIIIRASDFPDPVTGPESARTAFLDFIRARPDGEFGLRRIARLESFGQQ